MKVYRGRNLDLVSFPMGGIGAGMVCLQGTGSLGSVSVRNKPDVGNEPMVFSALTVKGGNPVSRVVEAPVPGPSVFMRSRDSGNGLMGKNYGLPRFTEGSFSARFPFATVELTDRHMPVSARIVGWSPFVPGCEDDSSLPFAALEYTFTNTGNKPVDAVYYFCASNFMKMDDSARVRAIESGFVLEQPEVPGSPHMKGAFCACVDEGAFVDAAWFRGGWFDSLTMLWKGIENGDCVNREHTDGEGPSAGATLAVPFSLAPRASRTIRLRLSWYVPDSDQQMGAQHDGDDTCGEGCCCGSAHYKPWYTTRFYGAEGANAMWKAQYDRLRKQTAAFTDCFYDSTLPEEILEAVSANLSILKSPTVLRQPDGRLWGWEGCCDGNGCCHGSCTHVWNYAQALCNLFPGLERSLRDTEFHEAQDNRGHQQFRAPLPIRAAAHDFEAASDGQLGGVIKMYRDWRISGDTEWLAAYWDRIKASLDYCIGQWDPDGEGVLKEPHHNTYDIEFWGPDAMCSSFYLGALKAACEMGKALGEDCPRYRELYGKGRAYLETKLYNGEYFHQQVIWEGLREKPDLDAANPEARALLVKEGSKYQYGTGCLSDGVLGVWLAELSGLNDILDEEKLRSTLKSIHTHNYRPDLSTHANPQRPGFAMNSEAGLLLCSWPRGGKPSLPFVYSDEVWTGIEYQVASHLIMKGFAEEGLEIVRGCRSRYDGTVRNPFNEYECGHWYARAMASYALLQAYTGVRYDNVTKTLYYSDRNCACYRSFLATATGWGTVELKDGAVCVQAVSGEIEVRSIVKE